MIIDSHTHLIPPDVIKNWSHYVNRDATFAELFHQSSKTSTAEQLIEAMNKHGIAISVVLGMGWTDNSLNEYVNDYLIESFRKYPDRIVPVTGIVPSSGNQGIYEAERCVSAGSRGFGEIHAYSQGNNLIDFDLMSPYIVMLEEYDYPLIVHGSEPVGHQYPGKGNTGPNVLESFVKKFPNVKIVLAHWGAGLPFYELMPEISSTFTNVFYDSAATTLLYREKVFEVVEKIAGPKRILFGSDYPLVQPKEIIGQIIRSDFKPDVKSLILSDNAIERFSIDFYKHSKL